MDQNQALIGAMAVVSLAMFLASLIVIPLVVIYMPADFFVRHHGVPRGPLRLVGRVAKNVFGWILLLAGVAMLVLPGQGLLSIVVGLSLIDFPGKRRTQRRLLGSKGLQKSLGWIRRKAHKEPLQFP